MNINRNLHLKIILSILLCNIYTCATYATSDLQTYKSTTSINSPKKVANKAPWLLDNGTEVCQWGANYLINFGLSFKEYERLGLNAEHDIKKDVYHMARLGFDAFRVHIFESEISDENGNLRDVKQLQLMDFLLNELSKRNIKVCITTMRYSTDNGKSYVDKWGGKTALLNNPESYSVQKHYITQLVNHINPYNGLSYKDDPNIINFELSNEPNHFKSSEHITEYIKGLIKAVKSTGCKKPLFYNFSQCDRFAKEYWKTKIDGLSTQWYTNGLTSYEKRGNQLPAVDSYTLPYKDDPHMKRLAKMIYEFSPANVSRSSYIYPAIARSLREAGYQFATQFSYDPIGIAAANEEYPKQYLNLVYTPAKALGMMVAGEAFHYIPIYKSYGRYPDNTSFGPFTIDYKTDLALMNSTDKYIYSNSTTIHPKNAEQLKLIAGHGTSPIVDYQGTGAYFLDKLSDGVWRLEIMPDILHVKDFYIYPCYDTPVTVLKDTKHDLKITLPGLGDNFKTLNLDNNTKTIANGRGFSVKAGVYLLIRNDVENSFTKDSKWRLGKIGSYYAPKSNLDKIYVVHTPPKVITAISTKSSASEKRIIKAQIIAPDKIEEAQIRFYVRKQKGIQSLRIPLSKVSAYDYEAQIPDDLQVEGRIDYEIAVKTEKETTLFPSEMKDGHGNTGYWKNNYNNYWHLDILSENDPVTLVDAEKDQMSCSRKEGAYLPIIQEKIHNTNTQEGISYSVPMLKIESKFMKHAIGVYVSDKLKYRNSTDKKYMIIYGHALKENSPIEIGLTMDNGATYGTCIEMTPEKDIYKISLDSFTPIATAINYKPVPNFIKAWLPVNKKLTQKFDIKNVENLQISFKNMKNGTIYVNETIMINKINLE